MQKTVQPVQNFFLANTQQKVAEFSITVKKFYERFETCGPGSVGDDLERGVMLLKVSYLTPAGDLYIFIIAEVPSLCPGNHTE